MSRHQVIVKELNAIQNLGSMDVLCTDKTGTLTQDKIVLERHLNVDGKEDDRILRHAFLNSWHQTGLRNLLDRAVIERTQALMDENPELENLMFDDYFRTELDNGQEGWRLIAADALLSGVAMPAMFSAVGYYDSRRRADSPSNLIQAQRDFFGAHTFERKDRPRGEFFHHEWNQPGAEL